MMIKYGVWVKGLGYHAYFTFDEEVDEDDGKQRAIAHAKSLTQQTTVVVRITEEDVWCSTTLEDLF